MPLSDPSNDRFLVLCGHAPIHQFVRFVRMHSAEGQPSDEIALTREWQRANAHLRDMESSQGNAAEITELQSLPPHLDAQAQNALLDPAVRKSLSFLPHRWAMVELDRLIVCQNYVNLGFAEHLRKPLPPRPSAEELLAVATGAKRVAPPLQVTPLGSNRFSFSSPSTDMRVLGAVPIDPAQVSGYEPYGQAAAVVAVYVGYSMNIMSAVQMGNRVMLVNGTHRAYALRAHGVTHAPCVVSRVSSRDDLDLVGMPDEADSCGSYFSRARPPLLKDYFDERLCRKVSVRRSQQVIQLDLKFDRTRIPVIAQY